MSKADSYVVITSFTKSLKAKGIACMNVVTCTFIYAEKNRASVSLTIFASSLFGRGQISLPVFYKRTLFFLEVMKHSCGQK